MALNGKLRCVGHLFPLFVLSKWFSVCPYLLFCFCVFIMLPFQGEFYDPDISLTGDRYTDFKGSQNHFAYDEIVENELSYNEVGPKDTYVTFEGQKNEEGQFENIFTFEDDDDDEIHFEYITYDESHLLEEEGPSLAGSHGGGNAEIDKSQDPHFDAKLEKGNFFKNHKRPSHGMSDGKQSLIKAEEKNPNPTNSPAKQKKNVHTNDLNPTVTSPKRDSTSVKDLLKSNLKKIGSSGLFKVSPPLMYTTKDIEVGGGSFDQVSNIVNELTKFATSYNKLANVLLQS